MARRTPRPHPTTSHTLQACLRHCPCGGNPLWAAYPNSRTVTTWSGVLRLPRTMRRGIPPACPQLQRPSRPAEAGRLAVPKHACGLDVIPVRGTWRSAQPRSVPEIPQAVGPRRVALAPRTVLHLLERSDARVALSLTDTARLPRLTAPQGRVILALDGWPPDVGHEVRWGRRDGLSREGLLARRMLSATQEDRAELRREVKQALGGPIVGGLSDGPAALRGAGETA